MTKLPESTIVEGRVLYTTAQMKQYGADCYAAGQGIIVKSDKPRAASVEALFKIFGGLK